MTFGPEDSDVVIAGDGIIGLSLALALADAGAGVTVIGDAQPGMASLAAAGLLSPSVGALPAAVRPFFFSSLDRYPAFLDRLRDADAGLALLRGILEVGEHEAGSESGRWMTASDVATLEPALSAADGARFHPNDAAIEIGRVVEALRRTVDRAGVRVRRQRVARVDTTSGGVTVHGADGARHACGTFVVAAGAWSGTIAGLPRKLPVYPLKGQMLAFDRVPLRHAVFGPDVYVVPREKETAVGATAENAGFDITVTEGAIDGLRRAAIRLCPAFADAGVVRSWAGLRPATPDMLPILGRDPHQPGVVYACGHSRNGVLLAPATADAVTALILGRPSSHDIAPFAITRFPTGSDSVA